jgi:hypothetical protein
MQHRVWVFKNGIQDEVYAKRDEQVRTLGNLITKLVG